MKDIKLGLIGQGLRGTSILNNAILTNDHGKIVAVCDLYEDRMDKCVETVEKADGNTPVKYNDYKKLINESEANTIVIASAWENHVDAAVAAIEAGKAVGLEVSGAYSIEDCWRLVRAWEKNPVPFMFLENCCYCRREMMVMNMVKKGLFGEIVHCAGAYCHDLRNEVSYGIENRHYRLRNYLYRNCENYPTHELGPIAQILNINRGNRMVSLTSVSSKARGLNEYIKANKPDDELLKDAEFKQGDVITTVIKCANGETITLTLSTTLPRFYSRGFTVCGTKGMYEEATDSVYLDSIKYEENEVDWSKVNARNADKYTEEYDVPMWKTYLEEGVKEGHGGVDYLEFKEFFECLREDKPMPIDVYDAASWMAVTPLSEKSIMMGGTCVEFPDFTNGKWIKNIIDEKDI